MLLALLGPAFTVAHAQAPSITFNFDGIAGNYVFNGTTGVSSAFDPSQVFIQFAQGGSTGFDGSYTDTSNSTLTNLTLTQSGGTYFSQSLSLSQMMNQSVTITDANSTIIYVSYGNALNVTDGAPNPTNPSDPNVATRWQPIEFTFSAGTGNQSAYGVGGGDLTAINVFSIPIQINATTDGNKTVGFNNGSSTTSIVSSLTSVVPSLTIMNSNISDNSGNFVRAIAPNSFGQGTTPYNASPPAPNPYTPNVQNGYGIGPYPSWDTAVGQLATKLQGGQTMNLTGNVAYKDSTYNIFYNYSFAPNITAVPGDASNYTISFTGNIAISGYEVANNSVTITPQTYTNLTITMAPDRATTTGNTDMELSAAIYQQVFTNLTVQNISTVANTTVNLTVANGTVFSVDWGNVGNLQPSIQSNISSALQQRVWGDFSEELLLGFPFINATANIDSGNLFPANPSDASPYPADAYDLANLTAGQYNEFGQVIWDASNGTVYANPYDDRFGTNLVGPGTNITAATWNITLLPDTTTVPEPGETAVLVAFGSLAAAYIQRKRRPKPQQVE
mgnify:CR=1 FL=1